jgi:hypothetical protein
VGKVSCLSLGVVVGLNRSVDTANVLSTCIVRQL